MRVYEVYGAITIVCIIIVRWVMSTLKWVWLEPKKLERWLRKQGLKGTSYKFLVGDMKDSSKMRNETVSKPMSFTHHNYFPRINPFTHKLLEQYGANSFMWMGPRPVINISEPELVREVFTRMNEFLKPKTNPLTALLVTGLVSYEGDKWAKHRKLINPAFHVEKLKLMLPAFGASITEMVQKWEKMVPDNGFCEADVWTHLTNLTGDVIARAGFGSSYEDGRRIFELLSKQKEIVEGLMKFAYIPGWTYLPTEGNRRMKEVNNEIQTLLKAVIEQRKKVVESGEDANNDLLGILLDSNYKQQLVMSFQDLIDECKLFFLAAHDTTAVLLNWTLILLCKYPDWQKKAREEVLATFGMNEPDYEGLNRLKIVTWILNEVLRLYPSVVTTYRRVFEVTKLGNMILPPGTVVSLLVSHANRDPKVWGDDAEEFMPERFAEGMVKATNGNVGFFPFGWGPRICIGQNFALTESKMAVSMILQRFALELSPSYTHSPYGLITLNPQFGSPLILRRLQ